MLDKPLAPGLYLVATPIGNLEDMTHRALRVLTLADKIACEDTRQTQKLLNHYAIKTPTISYHLFNEAERAEQLVEQLKEGARIAIVSDAGTPGIADPGTQLAHAAIAAGIPVFPIPGANAALSALIASGLPSETFTFHGFLASKSGQRRSQLEALPRGLHTHIFYETPHRILEALADIEALFGATQHVVLARELTKLHEEFLRGPASEVRETLTARAQVRGEMVLLFTLPEATAAPQTLSIARAVEALAKVEGIPEKDALKRVARERNISKSDAYRELQREQARRK
jgi:16S rRNA (cytidine1402-2'-O)-methyltransferase